MKKLIILLTFVFLFIPQSIYSETTKPIYTQQEMDYFTEIGLGAEYGGDKEILKWEEDINIKVTGNPSTENIITLHKVVTELNGLLGDKVKLSIVYENESSNVEIYFGKISDFRSKTNHYVSGNWGFFEVWSSWRITDATILISIDKPNSTEIKHMIREELTQILGLMQDSYKYSDSIFQQSWTTTQEYSELDKKIIQMLYLDEIKNGMQEQEVREVFGKLNFKDKIN